MLKSKKFSKNLKFYNTAYFAQGEYFFDNAGLFGGYRHERVKIADKTKWETYYLDGGKAIYNLNSAFLRYEHYFDNVTLYGGLGHAERSPDFWEMNKGFANNSLGVARKKKNTQLDIGAVYKDDISEVSANLFYSRVNDYILMTSRQTLNTDALIYGGEMDGSVKLFDILKLGAGISYTKGKNLKDIVNNKAGSNKYLNSGAPLPQIAPLQAKFEVGL